MIRKPPPSALQASPSAEWLRDAATTAQQFQKGGARVAKKAGSIGQALVLTWFGLIFGFGVLMTLLSNLDQISSPRGFLASLVMLAIPGGLIWAAIGQFKKAKSI